ncbi:hypothetical protein KIN34_12655 [Cellulomonas sp. DKR-3]|uniref:Uncharacterized protein n=1 Tax=Cellulomonas fulva TaxID=2835530 RepID=A0ABS5U151_9CELL|nr:hypothetical protein [Cellulomonas fulva]MBT0995132.1 hypothetical protein [Cellulomonas fulva]
MFEKYGLQLALAAAIATALIALIGYPLSRYRARLGRRRILALRDGSADFWWVAIPPEFGRRLPTVTPGGVSILSASPRGLEVWLRRPRPYKVWAVRWEEVEDIYVGPVRRWTDEFREGIVIIARPTGEMRLVVWNQDMRSGFADCEIVANELWEARERSSGLIAE